MAADRTDIYVLTDGSHGNPAKTVQEEAAIRKRQFEAEMEYVRPRSWHWLGVEDTKLASNLHALDEFDFSGYIAEEKRKLIRFHEDQLGGDCYVAVRDHELLGFIAVDVPSKNFLGPIGVLPSERHKGIAKALDLTGMKALRAKGYQYAISGMVHPWGRRLDEEITKLIPIPDSAGSYGDML